MLTVSPPLILCITASVALALLGHVLRLLRWEQFIRIYERPSRPSLLRGMGGGYAIDFFLPFHLGDVFRAVFCGRKMKSGVGFALATVIMDRFLDVWVVALLFGVFRLLGMGGAAVTAAAAGYLLLALVLAVLLALVLVPAVRDVLKKGCLAVCSIFNDTLKLDGLAFFWGLINTFKDLRRMKLGQLLLNTALMWAAYFGSYALLARSLAASGGAAADVADVFVMLFGGARAGGVLMALWYLLPALALLLAPLLPARVRTTLNQAAAPDSTEPYHNLLPQADPADRAAFLSQYFGLENKDYVERFIAINEGVTILQDYSSGSNATTMLCMDGETTFYRKYAFGADGVKLAEQLDWLRVHAGTLPLCDILRSHVDADCCWYDMAYDPRAVGMFRFIHSNPVPASAAILREVLDTLQEKLYAPTAAKADPALIEKYLSSKVDGNLARIREARGLRELAAADTVWVNGRACRGLPRLAGLFDHAMLAGLFADDPVGVIHADLTIENIICRTGAGEGEGAWYLIDPNTGSLHESPFLDYGKLLQSLHGGYEFMMMTPHVTVQGDRIEFTYTRSAAYDELLATLRAFFAQRFSERQMQSIFLHELIHWLRLMPYKLGKDRKRAPMFFGGLLLVANDIADWWPALLGEDKP